MWAPFSVRTVVMGRGLIERLYPRGVRGTLLLLLLVVLVPETLVEAFHYYSLFQVRRAEEFQNNLELARSVGAMFEDHVRDVLGHELVVGLALASPNPWSYDEEARMLTTVATEHFSIRICSWVSPEGRVVVSSEPRLVGEDVKGHPVFRNIEEGREFSVGDLGIATESGEETFGIGRGIRDERGVLLGIVIAEIDPRKLGSVLKVDRAGGGAIGLIDRQGKSVYRYPEIEMSWEQRDWGKTRPVIARALAGVEVTDRILGLTGEARLASYSPIPSVGWAASANRLEEEAMTPAFQGFLRDVGLKFIGALVALLVALAIARKITVPVARLQERALAIGRGEVGNKMQVTGPVELKELAVAFNRMAEEIRIREQEREQHIAELKRAEETIRRLAYHDALTGLPNRIVFYDRLNQALAQAQRNKRRLTVMILDIDRFKQVNDTMGHDAGDQLLLRVGDRLTGLLRGSDTVARMGGDEFMLLLPEVNRVEDAVEVAQRTLEAIRKPFPFAEQGFRVTTSIGIAIYPEDGDDAEALIKNADVALYRAKESGRDNYQLFACS